MGDARERDVVGALVSLATTLAEGYDAVDLLVELTSDCARLLDVASAGLLLADGKGVLHLLAASSEATHALEMYQLQREQGPCLDCYSSGEPVNVADLRAEAARWPLFVENATARGFAAVHALPMRLRGTVLGALGLFGTRVGPLSDSDRALAQAFAHVATVALIQERAASDRELVVAQLNNALSSRIAIEQAKGVLAQVGGLDMDAAFAALRRYSRDRNMRLTEVATAIVNRELPARQLLQAVSH